MGDVLHQGGCGLQVPPGMAGIAVPQIGAQQRPDVPRDGLPVVATALKQ